MRDKLVVVRVLHQVDGLHEPLRELAARHVTHHEPALLELQEGDNTGVVRECATVGRRHCRDLGALVRIRPSQRTWATSNPPKLKSLRSLGGELNPSEQFGWEMLSQETISGTNTDLPLRSE